MHSERIRLGVNEDVAGGETPRCRARTERTEEKGKRGKNFFCLGQMKNELSGGRTEGRRLGGKEAGDDRQAETDGRREARTGSLASGGRWQVVCAAAAHVR